MDRGAWLLIDHRVPRSWEMTECANMLAHILPYVPRSRESQFVKKIIRPYFSSLVLFLLII